MGIAVKNNATGEIVVLPVLMHNGCDCSNDIYGNMGINRDFSGEKNEDGDSILVGTSDNINWWVVYGRGYVATLNDIDDLELDISDADRDILDIPVEMTTKNWILEKLSEAFDGYMDYEIEWSISADTIANIRKTIKEKGAENVR